MNMNRKNKTEKRRAGSTSLEVQLHPNNPQTGKGAAQAPSQPDEAPTPAP